MKNNVLFLPLKKQMKPHKAMFDRWEPMIQETGLNRLKASTVMVVGIGGVGSFAVEALARSGIGTLILVDYDKVEGSNLNRQIHALHSTLGHYKVDVMKARINDINPSCTVLTYPMMYQSSVNEVLFAQPIDFVLDAIDTITHKIVLIETCLNKQIPFLTSCGQGNRMFPEKVGIKDLSKTAYDPVARVMRKAIKARLITDAIPCVYSDEKPFKMAHTRQPFSNALVPSTAGLTAAAYIIRHLLKDDVK